MPSSPWRGCTSGRAADRLHIARPALSQQIRQLQKPRPRSRSSSAPRQVGLTPDGAAFLPRPTAPGLGAGGCRAAEGLRVGARGRLRLGFVDSTAFEFVHGSLWFRSAWPNKSSELAPCRLMSRPRRSSTAISTQVSPARCRFGRRSIGGHGHDRFMLAVPADHTVAGRRTRCRCSGSHRDTFVGFSRTSSPRCTPDSVRCKRPRRRSDPAIEAASTTIVGLVATGKFALVPAGVRRLQLPNVAYVKVADADARVALVRLSRIDEPQTIVANAITELARIAAQ